MRYYTTYSIGIAKIQKLTIPSANKDTEQLKLSNVPGENVKWYSNFVK